MSWMLAEARGMRREERKKSRPSVAGLCEAGPSRECAGVTAPRHSRVPLFHFSDKPAAAFEEADRCLASPRDLRFDVEARRL
jgi:hypothetical protein